MPIDAAAAVDHQPTMQKAWSAPGAERGDRLGSGVRDRQLLWADLGRAIPKTLPQRDALIRDVKNAARAYRRELRDEQREALRQDRDHRIHATIERAFDRVGQSIAALDRARKAAPGLAPIARPSPLELAWAQELARFRSTRPPPSTPRPKHRSERLLLLWLAGHWQRHTGRAARGPQWQLFQACALLACGSRSGVSAPVPGPQAQHEAAELPR